MKLFIYVEIIYLYTIEYSNIYTIKNIIKIFINLYTKSPVKNKFIYIIFPF